MEAVAATNVRQEREIAEAVRQLMPSQWARLESAARKYAWAYGWGAKDLLQEAWCRALAGRRNWPDDVDLVRFMIQAMRSIADGETEKVEVEIKGELVPIVQPGVKVLGAFEPEDEGKSPEELVMDTENEEAVRQGVLSLFSDDEKACDIADGIIAGFEGEELRELVGLDKTAYASKRRSMRRAINKIINAEGRAS